MGTASRQPQLTLYQVRVLILDVGDLNLFQNTAWPKQNTPHPDSALGLFCVPPGPVEPQVANCPHPMGSEERMGVLGGLGIPGTDVMEADWVTLWHGPAGSGEAWEEG